MTFKITVLLSQCVFLLQNNNYSGYGDRSETDFLLHQSTDADRETPDVALEDVYTTQNEYMISREVSIDSSKSPSAICRSRSLVSPQRSEIFEPGGEGESDTEYVINDQVDILVENSDKNEKAHINEQITFDKDLSGSNVGIEVENGEIVKCVTKSDSTETTYDEVTGFPIYKRRYLAPRQFSVDYFEVDENGFEISNPIFEEDESEQGDNRMNGFVSTGLNQSDNSLNDNPTYQYGNQTEYCVNGDYRQQCYFNNEESIGHYDAHFRTYSPSAKLKSLSLSLSREHGKLENYSGICDSNGEKAKFSRMYSSDSYFGKRLNGLVQDTDSDGVFTISSSNVKSSIVPLAVYNSSSVDKCQESTDSY